jgi:DNA-binding LytR/AlgR family response regulator
MSEYLKIWLRDEPAPLVVLYSLKRLAEQLPEDRFLRIHRSYLVNVAQSALGGQDTVTVNGTSLPVSRKYKENVKSTLSAPQA